MPEPQSRTSRIEARIAPEVLAMVRRAADLEGRSVSDFMVSAAHAAARRAIEDVQLVRLSLEDQTRFVAALLDPPAPSDALKRAAAAHKRLVVKP